MQAIDFGRAIDLQLLPVGTQFEGVSTTEGMQCPEMLSGKPWHYCVRSPSPMTCCSVWCFNRSTPLSMFLSPSFAKSNKHALAPPADLCTCVLQHDAFCVAGTIHAVLLGKYIAVQHAQSLASKSATAPHKPVFRPATSVPSSNPRKPLWDRLFRTLLNCPLAPERPDVTPLLAEFTSVRLP